MNWTLYADEKPPKDKDVVVGYIHPISGRLLFGIGKLVAYHGNEFFTGSGISLPLDGVQNQMTWWSWLGELPAEAVSVFNGTARLDRYLKEDTDE